MKSTFLIFIFSLMFILSSCHSDEKNELSQRETESVDSVKEINNGFIQAPDSDYTGDYIDKYKNGVVKFSGFFRFGKRHGQWLAFYLNGEKWSECFYDKGLKEGYSAVYYPNGKMQYSGWYKNDLKDSVWSFYDTTGVVMTTKYFKNNEEIVNPNKK